MIKCKVALFFFASMVALADKRTEVQAATACTSRTEDDLKKFVRTGHANGVPFAEAREFLNCQWAVPLLFKLLNSSDSEDIAYKENVVLALGILGRVESIPGLINFLKEAPPGRDARLSFASYMAKLDVPIALGCVLSQINVDLAGRSKPPVNIKPVDELQAARGEVLHYLVESLVDSGAWNRRLNNWHSPYDSDFDRNLYLTKKTILGLGLAGDIAGECVLAFTEEHIHKGNRSRAVEEFSKCQVPISSTADHWGREPVTATDRDELQTLAADAVRTSRKIRSLPGGLAEYHSIRSGGKTRRQE